MIDKYDILQITLSIKPHLQKLMPAQEAHQMESDLDNLLKRFESEQGIEDLLLARITDQDAIREWLEANFQLDVERDAISKGLENFENFEGLAGDPKPVNADHYVCPIFGCSFEYYLNRAGRPVPACPFHRIPLTVADD